MGDDHSRDPAEILLKASATWEPPDGFALRVAAAARSDVRRETRVPRSLAIVGATGRVRAHLSAFAARRESTAWVLRQYWGLLRGR